VSISILDDSRRRVGTLAQHDGAGRFGGQDCPPYACCGAVARGRVIAPPEPAGHRLRAGLAIELAPRFRGRVSCASRRGSRRTRRR